MSARRAIRLALAGLVASLAARALRWAAGPELDRDAGAAPAQRRHRVDVAEIPAARAPQEDRGLWREHGAAADAEPGERETVLWLGGGLGHQRVTLARGARFLQSGFLGRRHDGGLS